MNITSFKTIITLVFIATVTSACNCESGQENTGQDCGEQALWHSECECAGDGYTYTPPPKIGSQEVTTNNLNTEIHVTQSSSDATTVEASFRTTYGTRVFLDGKDKLYVSTIGDPQNLGSSENLFDDLDILAKGVLPLNPTSGTSVANFSRSSDLYSAIINDNPATVNFDFILERNNNIDVRNSTLTLISPYVILSPVAGETLSRSQDMIITWDSSDPQDKLKITGKLNCSDGSWFDWESGESITATGLFIIPANTFVNLYTETSEQCSLIIDIDRMSIGQLDSKYGGGNILGHRIQTVEINTIP